MKTKSMLTKGPGTRAAAEKFLYSCLKNQRVWGLKKGPTWIREPGNQGLFEEYDVFPFWSERAYANRCAKEEWSGAEPFYLDLEDFIQNVLPDLILDDARIATEPDSQFSAAVLPAKQLLKAFYAGIQEQDITVRPSSVVPPKATVLKKDLGAITFAVDNVEPAREPLPECKLHDGLTKFLGARPEACGDYTTDAVAGVEFHPLVAAVHFAFAQHRPLVLSPDMIWIVIAQGFSQHIRYNAERLRSKFVTHSGKLELKVGGSDFVKGSPENPWPTVFAQFSAQIGEHIGATRDLFLCDFSTSGPVERAVSEIVMMEAFQHYFDMVFSVICGIPSITLEGRVEDWEKIQNRVNRMAEYDDLEWWLSQVRPICGQFTRAATGEVDLRHWRRIYKIRHRYGHEAINGWLCRLFPYLDGRNGPKRNPILEGADEIRPDALPNGLSVAPFKYVDMMKQQEYPMEFVGGFVGVTQNPESLAVRPKVGWAVRDVDKLALQLEVLSKKHRVFAGASSSELEHAAKEGYPGAFRQFYAHSNGAEILDADGKVAARIRSISAIEELVDESSSFSHKLLRFCDFADGAFGALDTTTRRRDSKTLWFVYLCPADFNRDTGPGAKIVAHSLTEFLDLLFEHNGRCPSESATQLLFPSQLHGTVAVSFSRESEEKVSWCRTQSLREEGIGFELKSEDLMRRDVAEKLGLRVIQRLTTEPALMVEGEQLDDLLHDLEALRKNPGILSSDRYAPGAEELEKWWSRIEAAITRARGLPNGGVFLG